MNIPRTLGNNLIYYAVWEEDLVELIAFYIGSSEDPIYVPIDITWEEWLNSAHPSGFDVDSGRVTYNDITNQSFDAQYNWNIPVIIRKQQLTL